MKECFAYDDLGRVDTLGEALKASGDAAVSERKVTVTDGPTPKLSNSGFLILELNLNHAIS